LKNFPRHIPLSVLNFSDMGVNFNGNAFGYYISSPEGVFKSQPGLNTDKVDHMVAFQGKNIGTVQLPGLAGGFGLIMNMYLLLRIP
jgi:hypothetical protein